MARNGSGTYSAPNTLVSGNTITAAGHNQNYSDIASELTNSVAADGQTSMTGPLKAANGTALAPTHTFAADTDTGMYRHGANELGFAVNGTLAGWFDSALKLWCIGAVDVAGATNLQSTLAVAGILSSSNTTSGTSTTAAAIKGKSLGLTENAYVGGTLNAPTISGVANINGVLSGSLNVTADTGANIVLGVTGGAGSVVFQGNTIYPNPDLSVALGASSLRFSQLFLGTTASTTPATGALVASGGVGIGGSAFVGGKVVSVSPTAGVGYATGAGGTAVQATSKSTTVTGLNAVVGQITTANTSIAAAGNAKFTFTNSAIAAGDHIFFSIVSGTANPELYTITGACGAGSAAVRIQNFGGGALADTLVLGFIVFKGATS